MKDLTDDTVLYIGSFLDPLGILNVALTCRRFGSATSAHHVSLMEQGARQLIEAAPLYERNWVPYTQNSSSSSTTWIGLYYELLKLRAPPTFNTILGRGIRHINNNKHHVYVSLREQYQAQQLQDAKRLILRKRNRLMTTGDSSYVSCVAIGNHIMRAGRHYVKFTMTRVEKISFGIIKPIDENLADDHTDTNGFSSYGCCPFTSPSLLCALSSRTQDPYKSNVYCCLYNTFPGTCQWCDYNMMERTIDNWTGMEYSLEGDVGLLLDLDEGTLTVYKNGRRLGIMKDGITGEYCWLMSIQGASNPTAVQIKRAPIPDA